MNIQKKIRAHIYVRGKVQGVYFRQNTQQLAVRRGVTGWVRNLDDGRVEAILEGDDVDVNEVIEWCYVGPPRAHVQDVEVKFEKYIGEFVNFNIKY